MTGTLLMTLERTNTTAANQMRQPIRSAKFSVKMSRLVMLKGTSL